MRIAEIYKSIQGEGLLTGTESVFVRASGCNLRCWYCDTPYASWRPEGEDMSVADIVGRVLDFDCRHVVVTGGEPMLFAELIPLCEALAKEGKHITMETAGTLYLPLSCDLLSISPKLANSAPPADCDNHWHTRHEQTRHAPQVIRQLLAEHDYQFKFVVAAPADCDEVERYLRAFPQIDRRRVMLMPQGVDVDALSQIAAWLQPYCELHHLRYCPRMQIEWFGCVRGT